ncbi:MAG: SDR family oxidoreductase [Segniliparus sp.]|uniref:SDR family oxidoreductase n=1 Tax=Segniliparus sp. TaxID=2804064 RepID=UPI003F37FB5C
MTAPKVAVAGATGLIGKLLIAELEAQGAAAVPIARSLGVDLLTGKGLPEALDGTSAVIDASNILTQSKAEAESFFSTTTANLLAAEQNAGVGHHVLLSIGGIHDSKLGWLGYYAGKRAQEELICANDVPYSILPSAQWFEFADNVLDGFAKGPFVLVPTWQVRPVAAKTVAQRLVALALGEPRGLVPHLVGPEPMKLKDLVRATLDHRGQKKTLLPLPVPKTDALLGGDNPHIAGPALAEWLKEQH